jgi:GR25 family glycosyltransferase involved in LPS biosynthesis
MQGYILTLYEESRKPNVDKLVDLFDAIRVSGIRGSELNVKGHQVLRGTTCVADYNLQAGLRPMNNNEIACALGHQALYQRALQDQCKYALFLEDDAWCIDVERYKAVCADCVAYLDAHSSEPIVIHIGFADWYPLRCKTKQSEYLFTVEPNLFNRATAYIANTLAIQELCQDTVRKPADDLICHLFLEQHIQVLTIQSFLFRERNNNKSLIHNEV